MINLALNLLKYQNQRNTKGQSEQILLTIWIFIKWLLFWYLPSTSFFFFFLTEFLFRLVFKLAGWFVSEGNGSFSINIIELWNRHHMSLHTSTHQFSLSVLFFWMKQNNNSAGQLIALLFSINLHYCHTWELPFCQRRVSIKRLPEWMYLPCIPKSEQFGSSKIQEQILQMKALCLKHPATIFMELAWGNQQLKCLFTAQMDHSSLFSV